MVVAGGTRARSLVPSWRCCRYAARTACCCPPPAVVAAGGAHTALPSTPFPVLFLAARALFFPCRHVATPHAAAAAAVAPARRRLVRTMPREAPTRAAAYPSGSVFFFCVRLRWTMVRSLPRRSGRQPRNPSYLSRTYLDRLLLLLLLQQRCEDGPRPCSGPSASARAAGRSICLPAPCPFSSAASFTPAWPPCASVRAVAPPALSCV